MIDCHQGLSDEALKQSIKDYCSNGRRHYDFYLEVSANTGQVDVETGSFTMIVDDCRKVYFDGRPSESVYRGTLSGTPYDFLANIKAIGKTKSHDAGICGAISGWLPVSYEGPSLFLIGNFVPEPMPQRNRNFIFKRDKYIPD